MNRGLGVPDKVTLGFDLPLGLQQPKLSQGSLSPHREQQGSLSLQSVKRLKESGTFSSIIGGNKLKHILRSLDFRK